MVRVFRCDIGEYPMGFRMNDMLSPQIAQTDTS